MTRAEFQESRKKAAARVSRRLEKRAELAALKGESVLTPKRKRKKSPTLAKLKKLLWGELRQVVYSWSPLHCQVCGQESDPVACHIVPSHEGAATRFFLPNLYRGCSGCNCDEKWNRVTWVGKHEEKFGKDFVDALREMARTIFDMDRAWVLEQTARMKRLRAPTPSGGG